VSWWIWILLGLALLGGELATPGGFYVLFFGVGALLVGGLAALGVLGASSTQWLLFPVLSVGALLLFRRRLLAAFESPVRRDAIDALRGEVATPGEDIAPGAVGKAELRGTSWTVRNADSRPLRAGERCRVERAEGLTLLIRGESV
jgi:membrane protein implicated in regulation of membrane protease activity